MLESTLDSDFFENTYTATFDQRLNTPIKLQNRIVINSEIYIKSKGNSFRRPKKSLTVHFPPGHNNTKPLSSISRKRTLDLENSSTVYNHKIRIKINTVESLCFESTKDKNTHLLDVDSSTNNTSVNSASSAKTPSPKSDINKVSLKSKKINHPARHLSLIQMEYLTKKKVVKNLEVPTKGIDLSLSIIEADKVKFQNELLFRKYRNHKVMKELYSSDDEPWLWNSHGISPTHRVRFVE